MLKTDPDAEANFFSPQRAALAAYLEPSTACTSTAGLPRRANAASR